LAAAIDLFAGAGGLSEGLEAAGIAVAAAQEAHPHAALSYALNHPATEVAVGDVRRLDLDLLASLARRRAPSGEVSAVAGGPPCQGFSTAGRRSADDPRNRLFEAYCEAVARFRPAALLLENVEGFRTMHGGAAFDGARGALERLGYELDWRVLDAAAHGVPQRRRRLILVGLRRGLGLRFDWPEPAPGPAPGCEAALADLDFLHPGEEAHSHAGPPRGAYQAARRAGARTLFNHLATRHRAATLAVFAAIPEGGNVRDAPGEIRSAKRTAVRMAGDRASNAVTSIPDDMVHYARDRVPTVREAARLQSFDDGYVFAGKRTTGGDLRRTELPQYTQVANAVPPLLALALGRALARALGAGGRDLRDLGRRERAGEWIRGSSAYGGYVLGRDAETRISDLSGRRFPLPRDESLPRVADQPPVRGWERAA
jgi:DNA (cytosine-5)-methyltransferase 1